MLFQLSFGFLQPYCDVSPLWWDLTQNFHNGFLAPSEVFLKTLLNRFALSLHSMEVIQTLNVDTHPPLSPLFTRPLLLSLFFILLWACDYIVTSGMTGKLKTWTCYIFFMLLKILIIFFVCFLSPAPLAKLFIGKLLMWQGYVRILPIWGGMGLRSMWAPTASWEVHLNCSCLHAECSRDIGARFGVCLLSSQGILKEHRCRQVNSGLISLSMEMCDEF